MEVLEPESSGLNTSSPISWLCASYFIHLEPWKKYGVMELKKKK